MRRLGSALRPAWVAFFGVDPLIDPTPFRRASPLTYINSVCAPVWIMQATHDTRTPPRQAYVYARALQDIGGDVAIEWYSGGHETSSRALEIEEHQRMVDLVQDALSGKPWSTGPVQPNPA